ncbi:hypothetical protein QR98_0031330 [Sarcoptes scabiei]|uniref:Uncharacterized protein n=1 Tax=Sarcoptes scabiei TaxID=52283 RepID=A0A132A0T0_SARSC|nr:hypothetical protein QR98_0031330 [Sarcoptes scabiei]
MSPIRMCLIFLVLILSLVAHKLQASPIYNRTDKGLDIDVWPFFKMHLVKEPNVGMQMDINVLSGMVKVNYDRKPGQKPLVNVEVFGIGGGNRRKFQFTDDEYDNGKNFNNADDDDALDNNIEINNPEIIESQRMRKKQNRIK